MKTLDGFGYNFNGIGEFSFIISNNASFKSQIRFEQAKNSAGSRFNNFYQVTYE